MKNLNDLIQEWRSSVSLLDVRGDSTEFKSGLKLGLERCANDLEQWLGTDFVQMLEVWRKEAYMVDGGDNE